MATTTERSEAERKAVGGGGRPTESTRALQAGSAPKRDKGRGIWGFLRSVGPALAIALAIRAFLFEPFSIPSGSMLPTLQIGDYVVVTKFSYGVRLPFTNRMIVQTSLPKRGDVIVFERPTPEPETLIKRVIGLPGETIRIQGGMLLVDGELQPRALLEERHAFDDFDELRRQWKAARADLYVEVLGDPAEEGTRRHFVLEQRRGQPSQGPWTVPEGHVLVLGDNRDNSADSRAFGYVPLGNIRGRADLIGFSWGKDGLRTDRILRRMDAQVPAGF